VLSEIPPQWNKEEKTGQQEQQKTSKNMNEIEGKHNMHRGGFLPNRSVPSVSM